MYFVLLNAVTDYVTYVVASLKSYKLLFAERSVQNAAWYIFKKYIVFHLTLSLMRVGINDNWVAGSLGPGPLIQIL